MENIAIRRRNLNFATKWSFGVGHILNDLCASMWFSYLLIYFHKVVIFNNVGAGIFLLIGQVADGLATPIIGIESDKTSNTAYGKRKKWHLAGTIAVALSFPFIFDLCIYDCANNPRWTLYFYYVPFIVMFQFGWASTQISHLALIPDLASNTNQKVLLNAIRYGFTIFSNVFVYAVFWLIFAFNSTPGTLGRQDASKFRTLVLIVVPVGLFFAFIFHMEVKERPAPENTEESLMRSCQKLKKTKWTSWFREVQFWQIGFIYMMTRLVVNISQVYIPLYVTDSLYLDKKSIAIVPLVIYVSGIAATAFAKPLSSYFGLKITYMIASILIICACCWFWVIGGLSIENRQEVYGAAILLGLGSTTLLITSLAMTAELVGDNTATGAFIYGAMSFFDKMANGIAVMVIQKLHPPTTTIPGGQAHCPTCAHYYRVIMSFVPGGSAVVGLIVLATLARSTIGSKKRVKDKMKRAATPINYGSTEPCGKTIHNIYGAPECRCTSDKCTCDSSKVLPSEEELAVCKPDCNCKICVPDQELKVCAEDCRCKICVGEENTDSENEDVDSEVESINSNLSDRRLLSKT